MRGSITKRGKDTWRVRIYCGDELIPQGDGLPPKRKQRFRTATIHGKYSDAEAYARKQIQAIEFDGELPANKTATFGEALDKWWAGKRAKLSANSRDAYEKELRLYLRPQLAHQKLKNITPASLQKYYDELAAQGLGPRIVRRAHMHVKVILAKAVRDRLLPANPADDKEIELPPLHRRKHIVFNPENARKFAAALNTHRDRALFLLALETGLRPSEYLALKWCDLDWSTGQIEVRRTVYYERGKGWLFSDDLKTTAAHRRLPLSPLLLDALRTQRQQVTERQAADQQWRDHDLIFPNRHGLPQHTNGVRRWIFKPLLRAAGLDDRMRLYDLRHTCATLLLAASTHVPDVSARLGHSSPATTWAFYAHAVPGGQERATATLAGIWSGQQAVNKSSNTPS